MRFVDEFRDPELAPRVASAISRAVGGRSVRLMEVCGTHTVSIFRSGLRDLLGERVDLLSGPGCPVCVTAQRDIDHAIALADQPGAILATYGDMIKVPGSSGSLQQARAMGADVRVVYSALDAVRLAEAHADRKVVFLGVGFETTAPTVAMSLLDARRRELNNFFVYSVHKLVPPALRALLGSGEVKMDGLILPGHVSVIIGRDPYLFLAEEYGLPAVITGFEPLDVLQAVLSLARMMRAGKPGVEVQYRRAVRPEGNQAAARAMLDVFEPADAEWRGLGTIPASGLRLREEYSRFDAEREFAVEVGPSREPPGCACGAVLCGLAKPPKCPLFAKACTPEHPVGPCMVSTEGTCAAYYAYGRE
ncbi:MAG: hydrogenase formation protein HypD [Dehalococcoidales bacterium]|nr:hydrogenase formation protein HypD [Dehalococcoidales bacterium]